MENIFINNLRDKGHGMAWEIMEAENRQYLGETWDTTQDKMGGNEDFYLSKLPQGLQEWAEKQMEEQTEIFFSIQRVHTSIHSLGQYLIIQNIINTLHWSEHQKSKLSHYIGWAWHLLHSEQ